MTPLPALPEVEALARPRSHSIAFVHASDRIWVGKLEAGAFDEDAQAADLIQEYKVKIAALKRVVGWQALELELLKGLRGWTPAEKRAFPLSTPRSHLHRPELRADGAFTIDL